MTFLTGYMEAMLASATDPVEIEMRRKVLEDHLEMQRELSEKTGDFVPEDEIAADFEPNGITKENDHA